MEEGGGSLLADGKPKPAKPRAQKTPLQKEVLEASYQLNQHPSVEHRKALGDRIELTEQEVQAWFTNRRRKDKQAEKKATTGGPATPGAAAAAGPAAAVPAAVPGAPAGTLPHAAAATGVADAAAAGPGSASPKPKAPRAPKAPKLSPTGPAGALPVLPVPAPPGTAAMGVAGPIAHAPGQLPPGVLGGAPMGSIPVPVMLSGPAGLARHVAPPGAAAAVGYGPGGGPGGGAAAAAAAGSAGGAMGDEEEETEDGEEELSGPTAAAWEGIRQLCVAARATLPEPYREDGPPLGFLFDEPGEPGGGGGGGGGKRRRIVLGADVVAEADDEGVKSVLLRRPGGNKPVIGGPAAGPVGVMTVAELEMRRRELMIQQQAAVEAARMGSDPDFMGPGGGSTKALSSVQKEQERLRRELMKQQERMERDRKREEDERSREMERHERERKKLQDKMEKERAKEEARKLKDMEKMKIAEERELRRLEVAREKERKAEERRRAVEERKKEKETARALLQQERLVLRQRHREGGNGPPDDEELEYRRLLEAAGIDPATIALDPEEDAAQAAAAAAADAAMVEAGVAPAAAATPPPRKRPRPELLRPEFPPPSLALQPAWPAPTAGAAAATATAVSVADGPDADMAEAGAGAGGDAPPPGDGLDEGLGTDLLVCWSFLHSFADLLGVMVPSLEGLAGALAEGEDSRLLGDVHCALLRLLQADMEDAHDEKERVGRQTAAAPNFMDKSVVGSARRLEEAWAWGFDVDSWRAHLNVLTWPEVLRQIAVVWGRGRSRPHVRRPAQGETKGPRIQGLDGEDVLDDGATGGSLKLRMPARYTHGTVKAAAWQVLANTGPSGLSVGDLVRRIQKTGLREMRSSKTPEAVVAGSLARDVLFTKVQPATWALTAVVAYHKRKNEARERREGRSKKAGAAAKAEEAAGGAAVKAEAGGGDGGDAEMAEAAPAAVKEEVAAVKKEAAAAAGGGGKAGGSGGGAVKQEPGSAVKEEPAEEATGAAPMDVDSAGVKQEAKDAAAPGPSTDGAAAAAAAEGDGDEESYSGDEEEQQEQEEEPDSRGAGDPWVATLLCDGYGCLGLRQRIEALSFLCHAVLDSPTLRAKLELRTNEAVHRRKMVFEDAKNEKRKRQEEAAARAAAMAEEARKKAEAAAAGAGGAAATAAGAGSRASTPAPPGAAAAGATPVDAKAIAAELFGGAAAGPPDPAKAAEEARKRVEEEEDERVKRQQRAEEIRRIDEECAIRAEPLGSDRRYNRYWLFTSGAHGDAGTARLWVESAPDGAWRLLTTAAQFDELVAALEPKGLREGALAQALGRVAEEVKAAMPGIAPVSNPTPMDVLPAGQRHMLEEAALARAEAIRLQAMTHLPPGDDFTSSLALPEEDSGRMQRLKRDILRLEAAVPAEAVDESFHRLSWVDRVQSATSLPELRAGLGQLEAALLPSPDGVTPGLLATVFHRAPPLVRGAWVEVGREVATALPGHASKEVLPPVERPDGTPAPPANDEPLAWLPATLPALALRLLSLDASIVYRPSAPPGRDALAGYKYTVRPAPLDAQPMAIGEEGGQAASAALPLAVGGGAVVLTNVLADRGRVREASRRVPELPAEVMAMRARDFLLPVEELREAVAEADREGLLNPVSVAAAAAPAAPTAPPVVKGRKVAKHIAAAAAAAAAAALAAAAPPAPAGNKGRFVRSVVVVSGGRGPGQGPADVAVAAGGGAKANKKGGSRKAAAPAAGPGAKGRAGGSKAKKAAPPPVEEDGEDDWVAGGERLGEPVLLGAEDEDDTLGGFRSDDDDEDGNEEGVDDPDDSDYA